MQTDTEINDGRAVLRVQGGFDLAAYRDFRKCCHAALEAAGVKELELDLALVRNFDGMALGVLLLLKEKVEHAQKRFILSNCGDDVRRVLDIARLRHVFGVA